MDAGSEPPSEELVPVRYAVGIDVGSQACSFCARSPDKDIAIKPTTCANAASGFALLNAHLARLGVPPEQVLVGLEATSRYGENLWEFLAHQGYQVCLLHPAQTHQFAQRRGLRAKTDKLDASTIAHVLLSAEARYSYVKSDLMATYRELVRLHTHLSDEAARYKNEIHALLVVLFPRVYPGVCRSLSGDSPGLASVLSKPPRRLPRPAWRPLPSNYMSWLRVIMGARRQSSSSARTTSMRIRLGSTPAYAAKLGPVGPGDRCVA